MADETKIKQLSDDEYNRMMHGSFAHEAIKSAMANDQQNVQATAAPGIVQSQPAIPPKINLPKISKSVEPPVAGQPDPNAVAQQVNQTIKNLQISTPPPKPPSAAEHLVDQITSNWQIPAAIVGVGTAIAGANYLINRKGLKDRDISNRKEPTLNDEQLYKPVAKEEPQTKFAKDFEIKYGVPLATAEEISGGKITKQWEADIVGNAIKNQLPITVKKEAPVITTTATTQPATMTAVVPTETPATTTVASVTPTEEKVSKGPKKEPVVASFKTAKDIPEGFVFRPDVGNLDRSMFNILGPEHRQYAKELLTGGKMFGHSPDVNADVSKLSTEYFQKLQSQIPEAILSRDERRAQGIPSKFGNYGLQNFGRAAKVAGVAGTLFAVADLANAKTSEQKATAGANLIGSILPPGADILEAGKGSTLSPEQVRQRENAYLLGSPYAQTEEAKKARLREKAGAGRGIAPPSAYMR